MTEKLDLSFLLALNLGEKHVFPNKPTSAEKRLHSPRYAREAYRAVGNRIFRLRQQQNQKDFKLRVGDWDNPKTIDTVEVWCVRDGDKAFDMPPSIGGFRAAVKAHEKKQGKVAELKEELAQPAPPPAPHDPPHLRPMTVDDQMKLVKLVQAHAAGETIQQALITASQVVGWTDAASPDWKLPVARLRIKPKERRTVYVIFDANGNIAHATAVATVAKDDWRRNGHTVVEFLEQFPEDEES